MHTFSAGVTIILRKILTSLRGWLFHVVPGDLKPLMDTYLHASRREVNQNPVTKPGLKQGMVVIFWVPKRASEAISQQTPLASAYTLTLPLGYLYR